jgi:hypothetical protein
MPHAIRVLALVLPLVLAAPAGAGGPRTLKVRFPRTLLPAATNVEVCVFVRLPIRDPFELGGYEITQRGRGGRLAINHFLVYVYQGERLAEFATEQQRVVASRGCLDLGPVDRGSRQLLAVSRSATSQGVLPRGLGLPLAPVPAVPGGPPDGIGILLDANWLNGSQKPATVSATVVLRRAKPGGTRRRLQPILAREAEAGIDVAPFAVRSTASLVDARWRPARDVCLYAVTGHMHRRGRFFGAELLDAADQPRAPLDGLPDRLDGNRPTLFGSPDFTDPDTRRFPGGLLVRTGESLRFSCWHDNGETVPVRLGCEETAGVPPGSVAGGPAKLCSIAGPGSPDCPAGDPRYPGRTYTGACVAANLVAGAASQDESCALAGFYYDAVAGAPDDAACDVSRLPPLP